MKRTKIFALMLLLALPAGIFAQDEAKSRKSFELPKAGDIGLGIDVVPLFRYAGNMFNQNLGNTLNVFGGTEALDEKIDICNPDVSIMGKYMLTDQIALRANIGVLVRTKANRSYQPDDAAVALNPLSEAQVIDTEHIKRAGGSISLGAEYRRGYKRIQGYGGADLIYGFESKNITYEYGNAITNINQEPSRTVLGTPMDVDYWTKTYVTGRYYDGNTQYVGLGLHVGVEIFLASHVSIGGEVSLYALGEFGRQCYQTQEGYNPTTDQVETRTELVSPGNTAFTFGTDNLGGKLYMMFYF